MRRESRRRRPFPDLSTPCNDGGSRSRYREVDSGIVSGPVLREQGTAVDLFGEAELFSRPEFVEVAEGFRRKTYPTPEIFLPAYAATIVQLRAKHAWGIFDWNCAGMASDLPWAIAEPIRLQGFVRQVQKLSEGMAPVVLSLSGDIQEATRRAALERGRPWVDYWTAIADEHGALGGSDLERIAYHHEQAQERRLADLEVLRTAGWQVINLDARAGPDEVLTQSMTGLAETGLAETGLAERTWR